MPRNKPVASQNTSSAREYLSPVACRRCRQMVGSAVCEGLTFQVDIAPLSRLEVAASVLAGRWVFEVRGYSTRRWLKLRRPLSLARADFTADYPLIREHRCKEAT